MNVMLKTNYVFVHLLFDKLELTTVGVIERNLRHASHWWM